MAATGPVVKVYYGHLRSIRASRRFEQSCGQHTQVFVMNLFCLYYPKLKTKELQRRPSVIGPSTNLRKMKHNDVLERLYNLTAQVGAVGF